MQDDGLKMRLNLICVALILGLFSVTYQTIPDRHIHSESAYAALFEAEDEQLLYIANTHETNMDSLTFQWIRSAFVFFKPDLVIFEGIETSQGISPEFIKKRLQGISFPSSEGEILYAAHLALNEKIDFLGGEPSDSEIFKNLEVAGYTHRDVIFFYFTRQIPQYYSEKKVTSQADIKRLFPEFMAKYDKACLYSFDQYRHWLYEKNSQELPLKKLLNSELTAPIENGNYLQKLSSKIGVVRDSHVVQTILTNLKSKKKILVIFGKSHLPVQISDLERNLGYPHYFTDPQSFKDYIQESKRRK